MTAKDLGRHQRHVGARRDLQVHAGGELAVAERSPVARDHLLALDPQVGRVRGPAPRRLVEQELAHAGGGVADGGAALGHRVAAGGEAFVGGPAGVGGDQLDLLRRDAELLGRHHGEGGAEALAELRLAGEDGDLALRADADPGIEHRGVGERAGELLGLGRLLRGSEAAEREADDEPARAGGEKAAPGQKGVHSSASASASAAWLISSRARRMARRMRICVPQRQRLYSSACRIAASSAVGLACRSAWARIIMPGMQ